MALLDLHDITLTRGHTPLLDGVNLQIEEGEKVCLVGRNGCGKTSLMQLINGELQPDGGEIAFQKGCRTAYLAQEIPAARDATIYDVVGQGKIELSDPDEEAAWEQQHKVEKILSLIQLDGSVLFNTLSVGLKRRVLLGRALVSDPDILMLDEPTNHLDIQAISWLENFIAGYKKAVLFVTHDRAFLQKIAGRIICLDRGMIKSYPGDYKNFLIKREEEAQVEAEQNDKFDKKLAEEETWVRQGIKARRKRNEGRVRALQKMRDLRADRKNRLGRASFSTQESVKSGKKVIEVKNISFSYDQDNPIVDTFSALIMREDKVGIIGPNGCGKSTLIKLLLGLLSPAGGTVNHGTNLEIAYFDQTRDQLDDSKTLFETIGEGNDQVIFNGKPRHVISYLEDFLFSKFQIEGYVGALSGGEKNRLLLAKLFTRPANLLVLDEPTNDLDIETLELLEELLINYTGTVLLVSHDREFINNVVSDTIVFEGSSSVRMYTGGYDDWRSIKANSLPSGDVTRKEKQTKQKTSSKSKLSYKEKKELEAMPALIEKLEAEQDELHKKVEDPAFYKKDPAEIKNVQERLEELESELEKLYERWEELESIEE